MGIFQHIPPLHRDQPGLSPELADWWDRHVEGFRSEPDWGSLLGYRNAELLVQGLENAGPNLTIHSLIQGLESIRGFEDFLGLRSTFGPNDHEAVEDAMLSVVVNGRWEGMPVRVRYDKL